MDGILIIDKPAGWTSHDVVARVRRILNTRRVGHTGTLDPFATGVLVVLVGQATRLAQFLASDEKEYEATVRFGYATNTGDLTGERRDSEETNRCAQWSDAKIESALAGFRGKIEQVPPMYSAKKVQGRKLYELARRGEEVVRAPVQIHIHKLEVIERDGTMFQHNPDGTCDLILRVVCSAGTYIRALAEDLGARLGTGAHLTQLRRTRAGKFCIERATTLNSLQIAAEANCLSEFLITPEAGLSAMTFVHLNEREAQKAHHGAAIEERETSSINDKAHVALLDSSGKLIAVAIYDAARKQFRPNVVFSSAAEKSS
jgi:tRNA pseudouridine55 synthase